jgi:hypothetical protein
MAPNGSQFQPWITRIDPQMWTAGVLDWGFVWGTLGGRFLSGSNASIPWDLPSSWAAGRQPRRIRDTHLPAPCVAWRRSQRDPYTASRDALSLRWVLLAGLRRWLLLQKMGPEFL